MKLKRVAQICSQTGVFYLMDRKMDYGDTVEQWLGDGYAIYPIAGLPYMEEENIYAMFDISEKKQEKLVFRHNDVPEGIDLEDVSNGEMRLDEPKLCVRFEGKNLMPLQTSAGITLIQEKYLAPLDGAEYMQLYERRSPDGGVYIVAKVGMIVQAVIMPFDAVSEGLVEKLDQLTKQCRYALARKERLRQEALSATDGQENYQVDKSTGEVIEEGGQEDG